MATGSKFSHNHTLLSISSPLEHRYPKLLLWEFATRVSESKITNTNRTKMPYLVFLSVFLWRTLAISARFQWVVHVGSLYLKRAEMAKTLIRHHKDKVRHFYSIRVLYFFCLFVCFVLVVSFN